MPFLLPVNTPLTRSSNLHPCFVANPPAITFPLFCHAPFISIAFPRPRPVDQVDLVSSTLSPHSVLCIPPSFLCHYDVQIFPQNFVPLSTYSSVFEEMFPILLPFSFFRLFCSHSWVSYELNTVFHLICNFSSDTSLSMFTASPMQSRLLTPFSLTPKTSN